MRKLVWLVVAFSCVGIFGSLAPWINYPRVGIVVNGYQGDGWVLAFVFLIINVLSLFVLKYNKLIISTLFIVLIFNILISILIYNKINLFEEEKLNFNSDDPYLITAAAGSHIAYGLYIVGISSLFNVFSLAIYFIQNMRNANK